MTVKLRSREGSRRRQARKFISLGWAQDCVVISTPVLVTPHNPMSKAPSLPFFRWKNQRSHLTSWSHTAPTSNLKPEMCSPSDLTIQSQSLHPHTLWFFSSECSQSAGGISYEFVTHTHPRTCIWKQLTFKLNWEEVLLLTCSYPFLDRNKRKDRSGWEA